MRTICIIGVVLASVVALAEEPDYQFRTLLHLQRGRLASWVVVPDWTAKNRKVLAVGGLLLKYADKRAGTVQWTEFLAGGFIDETRFEPVVNIRTFRSTPRADGYADVLHNFRLQRTVATASLLFPLAVHLKLGGESEIVRQDGRDLTVLLGSRTNVPFSCDGRKCVVAATYFANVTGGDNVLRVYALVNF